MAGASGDPLDYSADGLFAGCASLSDSTAGQRQLEATLDERYASSLAKIEALWRARASGEQMRAAVHECLSECDDPYEAAVYLVENCSDLAVRKANTLACTLARDVEKWTVANGDDGSRRLPKQHRLSSELLERAFDVATRHHLYLFDAMCGLMDFRAHAADLVDRVDCLVDAAAAAGGSELVSACQLVLKLGLQQRFRLAVFAVPLIAQDRVNVLEQYVDDVPALQVELVSLFDELCRPPSDELLQSGTTAAAGKLQDRTAGASLQKLQKRVLAKHGLRLMKKYGVSPESCQHVLDYHGTMSLGFLFRRHFVEQSMSREAFCELLAVAAGGRQRLLKEALSQLFTRREIELAALWARHWRMSSTSLPAEVAAAVRALPAADCEWWSTVCPPKSMELQVKSNDSASSEYYASVLPFSEVEMVDTVQAYRACIAAIIANGGPLAIDCEWAPSFSAAAPDRPLSVMQLAVRSHVWLLDLLTLPSCLEPGDWAQLKQLFRDRSVIKLGFGFSEDFRKMSSAVPGFSSSDLLCFVDLAQLYATSKPARPSGSEGKGLADVVKVTLGKPLDKQEQMSNWERRPLRQAQLRYAAQDAHCLLAVYDALLSQAEQDGSPVSQLPAASGGGRGHAQSAGTVRLPTQESAGGLQLHAAAGGASAAAGVRASAAAERAQSEPDGAAGSPAPKVWPPAAAAASAAPPLPWPAIDPVRGSSVDEPGLSGLSAADLHVVVDRMLQGLGKKLRNLGIDTLIAGNDADLDDVARLCLHDGRVLLSAGEPCRRFGRLLPPDRCFAVDHALPADEQAELVLSRFGVRLTAADIFGRCQACNCGDYVDVPAAAMRTMCSSRASRSGGVVGGAASAGAPPARADATAAASSALRHRAGVARSVDYESACLSTGVPLQLDDVRPGSLDKIDVYRVCAQCGKVFWEGSHHRRMAKSYADRLGR